MHVLIVGEPGVKADDSLLTETYGLPIGVYEERDND